MGTDKMMVALAAGMVSAIAMAGGSSCEGINVRIKGPIGDRLDKMIRNHVIATDTEYITAPFLEKSERRNWWQTEFWGKYMHSAAPFWVYTGDRTLAERIGVGLANILASQEPGGYIGNYPDELRCGEGWDVWGMKYSLMGLIHYYDAFKTVDPSNAEKAIAAAKRLCDYVIAELGPGGKRGRELWETGYWSGFASSSILEPVVWLYNRTNEKRFLDFATYIVKGMSEPESGPRLIDLALKGISVADRNGYGNTKSETGGYVAKHNRWKAYEMMSCYQGLLEYYEVTGRKDCLEAAIATGDQIIRDEINIAGGCASSEAWFHGAKKQHLPYTHLQETCVTTTWMRFAEKLLEVTGEVKYADELEKTFYNAYLAAMRTDGGEFAAYTPLNGVRWSGHDHCFMHANCCNANGPRGFLSFLRAMFTAKEDTAYLNFYVSGRERVKLPKSGREVAFESYAVYPRTGLVRLVNHTVGTENFTLALRIPAFSADTSVKINGEAVKGVKAGEYLRLTRDWTIGDVVEINFDMAVKVHFLDHAVAYSRGPIALARDSRFNDGPLDATYRAHYGAGWSMKNFKLPKFDISRTESSDFWMVFTANLEIGSHYENPEGKLPKTVHFCDYASAGNSWRDVDSYRVWQPCEYGPNE